MEAAMIRTREVQILALAMVIKDGVVIERNDRGMDTDYDIDESCIDF